ncbi:hypothetical protein LCGC14_1097850 [marine sediment metagenome]|uniref:Uncharacterized protein n=1 Tax=marine sediment metagenome TaxID=412755 RepID=A0A0F9MY98_9ZZZZ
MIESKEKIFAECTWTDPDGVVGQTSPTQFENKEKAENVTKRFCKIHLRKHSKDLVRYEVYSLKTVRKILSSEQFRKTS